jgi:hypothetical protein
MFDTVHTIFPRRTPVKNARSAAKSSGLMLQFRRGLLGFHMLTGERGFWKPLRPQSALRARFHAFTESYVQSRLLLATVWSRT